MSKKIEIGSWVIGSICLITWSGFSAHHEIVAESAITDFEQRLPAPTPSRSKETEQLGPPKPLEFSDEPDVSTWAPARLHRYLKALSEELVKTPEAIMTIPSVDLKAPLFTGIDEWSLNAGIGLIPGTADLETTGNVGIAGHRDGFFRALKDVALGDRITLQTLNGPSYFEITDLWIVDPEDVEVLAPTTDSALTLVTCYPFYFVGNAPQRFIVRATKSQGGIE